MSTFICDECGSYDSLETTPNATLTGRWLCSACCNGHWHEVFERSNERDDEVEGDVINRPGYKY